MCNRLQLLFSKLGLQCHCIAISLEYTTWNHVLNKEQAITIPNKAPIPDPNLHSSPTTYHGCPIPNYIVLLCEFCTLYSSCMVNRRVLFNVSNHLFTYLYH